ncbi:hypothetical protein HMI55_006787 [Coelomomyces lativittatus]|nr:hypothetical protein HMI55_006787 [Coelomomyces lativittatus]
MYVFCKTPKSILYFQNIPTVTLEYKEVKRSIPTSSEEEYEKWKNIPEDKLLDTPPESYDFSEFVAISYTQGGKIFAGKRYNKCKTIEDTSFYIVGVVYYEAFNYHDRSLSKDEVERQWLFSCSPKEFFFYYREQKSIREWEIMYVV